MDATIKENITFGKPFERERFERVVAVCELQRDLEIMPKGEFTEIGSRGINLSGGQKARVSLARAVYSDRNILLLDDVISALDPTVAKRIVQNCLLGDLKNKTRILVTHSTEFLEQVDRIVMMDQGRVIMQGKFEQIKEHPKIKLLMEVHHKNKEEQARMIAQSQEREKA
jgi:ABC-type bacteriocin/lantibiotic exporter with double-glycine peptidase domain